MLHNSVFGPAKNLLRLTAGAQSANGVTAQAQTNSLLTLSGTASADTTLTMPTSLSDSGWASTLPLSGQCAASLTEKGGYATGTVTATIMQNTQATQVITNGNFAGGTTGWTFVSVSGTAAANTLTISATGASSTEHYAQASPSLTAGHKYYICCTANVLSGYFGLKLFYKNASANYVEVTGPIYASGTSSVLFCFIATVPPDSTGGYLLRLSVRNASGNTFIAAGEQTSIANVMIIDMGASATNPLYNLTANQMAAIFTGYFEGAETAAVPLSTVSAGSPATFSASGQVVPSVQLSIPSGTSCQDYEIGVQIEVGATATAWVPPGMQGIVFYPATGETGTITNTGNVDAYPVITITGPCANPAVSSATTGETVACAIALGTKDKLVIDCRPSTRGCYLNGALKFGIKQGLGWIHCPPGDNVLTFTRDGYDTKRHCSISLQGRYL